MAPPRIAIPSGLNTASTMTPRSIARYARQPFARFRFGCAQIEPSQIKGNAAKNQGECRTPRAMAITPRIAGANTAGRTMYTPGLIAFIRVRRGCRRVRGPDADRKARLARG